MDQVITSHTYNKLDASIGHLHLSNRIRNAFAQQPHLENYEPISRVIEIYRYHALRHGDHRPLHGICKLVGIGRGAFIEISTSLYKHGLPSLEHSSQVIAEFDKFAKEGSVASGKKRRHCVEYITDSPDEISKRVNHILSILADDDRIGTEVISVTQSSCAICDKQTGLSQIMVTAQIHYTEEI